MAPSTAQSRLADIDIVNFALTVDAFASGAAERLGSLALFAVAQNFVPPGPAAQYADSA